MKNKTFYQKNLIKEDLLLAGFYIKVSSELVERLKLLF